MKEVNLDYGAATPLDPAVVQAMLPYMTEHYGNPSSGHDLGKKPRKALAEAREKVAALISADPGRLVFTASASEANNTAIKGVASAAAHKGRHIIASAIEHFSVLNPLKSLEKEGFQVTLLPVNNHGLVDPQQLVEAITPQTILITIGAANPEIGTVQDLAPLAAAARERGIPFHTDAAAAAGWIPLSVKDLEVDLLTLAGDQLYGPKGSAALYVGGGVRIKPLVEGGVQERGLRAGTENIPAMVGLGEAASVAAADLHERFKTTAALRDRLKDELFTAVPHLHLNGHPSRRLPHNLNISVEFVEGEALLMHLNMAGIYVSSGSSCTSHALKSSHVLAAMGLPPELAQGSLLFTLGKDSREGDISHVSSEMARIASMLRSMSPLYQNYLKKGRE